MWGANDASHSTSLTLHARLLHTVAVQQQMLHSEAQVQGRGGGQVRFHSSLAVRHTQRP